MNFTPITKNGPLPLQKQWAISCGLACLLLPSAFAQSAANFDTKVLSPKPSAPKEEKTTPAAAPADKEAKPASTVPSRYVGEADLDAYIATVSNVLSIRDRATDPFGQYQDPDAKPIVKQSIAKNPKRAAAVQATPLAEIIRLLQVTTIMPGEKRFLVGTRSIKQGDTIPLTFRGRIIRVDVTTVNSRLIEFRNPENGETAPLNLNLLPTGMTPGTRGITAPGMVPDLPNAPIELDPGDAHNDNSQNR